MRTIAHRGLFSPTFKQNTLEGVLEVIERHHEVDMVEIDVRFTTDRRVVLCHDREYRNNRENCTLEIFLKEMQKKTIDVMIDIKAFGILEAQRLARAVVETCSNYCNSFMIWLCSFNEYCVSELLSIRETTGCNFKVGVISSGIPLGMFNHLENIDFVSLDYSCVCEDVVERLHNDGRSLELFVWVVNDESMKRLMASYKVDGLIQDF